MKTYVMKMWLTCNRSEEVVLADFDLRFPRVLERKWAEFVIEADPTVPDHLGKQIDTMIYDECKAHLKLDVDANAKEAKIFGGGGGWVPGEGGQHEGRESVQAKVGNFPSRWKFKVNKGTPQEIEAEIFINTRHHELT